MTEVPHLGFILAAYSVTALVLGGTALAVLMDGRALRRQLARLERGRSALGGAGRETGAAE